MTNILGPYCSFWHWRAEDEDYIRRLDPAWARIHQPTARAIHVVQQAAPSARIMLRSWDIDDNNGKRKQEMYADPKGAARLHLAAWRTKWEELERELRRNGWAFNTDRWYLGLVNEPDPNYVAQVVEYSLEAMRLVQGTDIRLGVVASSVGTFSKPSENANGWASCRVLEKPINDGRHILMVHEYWQPEGPSYGEDGGNLAWRHRIIPLDVPILIAESGANGYIYQRHSPNDDAGWQKFMKPEQYAAQVKEYIEGCDQRVKGVLLYMLDFHSDQWWSFDTQPAMNQLLAIANTRPTVASPFATAPVTPALPPYVPITKDILAVPQRGTVTANILNARSGPGTSYPIVRQLAQGDAVTITAIAERVPSSEWLQIGAGEWVIGTWVRTEDEPVLQPAPAGDNWARCLAFVLRWESGWADDPNDPGGATMKGITIGTYTRWREAQDQPKPSKDDLRAITDEEVGRIYFEWYWMPSAANTLSWPMCLAVMDLAVNGGIGRAREAFAAVGHNNFLAYMAWRLEWYTRIDGWKHFSAGWARRVADLMKEASL